MRLAATRNLLKVWGFVLVLCAGLGLLGWSGGGYPLLSSVVFCSLLATAAAYWYADRVVMGMVGARELALAEAPLVHSTLERLAARANVAKPKLYVIPDGHPRAFAAGRGPRGSAIAVSRGLLGAAPPAELEGVLAHELAHVRARDVVTQEGVVVFAAALVEATRIGGALQRLLLFVLGPIAAAPGPPAALAEARVRRGPVRGRALRVAARHRRRVAAPRARGRAGRVPRQSSHGAALHDQPLRADRARSDVRHAPADRRARPAASRARP